MKGSIVTTVVVATMSLGGHEFESCNQPLISAI